MIETRPAQFQVVGKKTNHLWLEVLCGAEQGMQVSVPIRSPQYDPDIQERVLELETGDVETVRLRSERESDPDWYIQEFVDSGEAVDDPEVPA